MLTVKQIKNSNVEENAKTLLITDKYGVLAHVFNYFFMLSMALFLTCS